MMVDTNKLRGRMVEKGISQEGLAKAIGLDRSTVNRKLKTGEDFSIGEANRIAEALHLSRDEAVSIFFTSIVA